MQVYVEYVIIDNLIIDFLLLKLSTKTVQVRSTFFRLSISSLIGTCVAVIMPLFTINSILQIIIKVLLAFVMCLISAKTDNLKKHFLNVCFFVLYTFLLGGSIIALFYLAGVDYKVYFTLNYNAFMPIGITILLAYLLYLLLCRVIKSLLTIKNTCSFVRKCAVVINDKKFIVTGYVDSGNLLYDNTYNLPIIIASKNLSKKLFSDDLKVKKNGVIKYQTASGEGDMQVYVLDKLLIYNGVQVNVIKNVLIGKSEQNFYGGECDLLLHPSLI